MFGFCYKNTKSIFKSQNNNKENLISCVVENVNELIVDQYGNYVVQYVIELKDLEINSKIADIIGGHIKRLANEKFSSNAIEKVFYMT